MDRKASNMLFECMKNKPRIYGKECWEKIKADKKKRLDTMGIKRESEVSGNEYEGE